MAKTLLGKDLNKSSHITRSNWEASTLSEDQVRFVHTHVAMHTGHWYRLMIYNSMAILNPGCQTCVHVGSLSVHWMLIK